MYYSMFLGPRVFSPAGDLKTIDALIEQALEADEAGFSAIYVGEQHNNDYEPYSDPFTMAGYLAAQMKQAWLGTSVVPLVLQHPMRLIERMNLLDLLTRGRVMYGLSSGTPTNGAVFGIGEMDAPARSRLFDQRLELLLRAWAHRPEDGPLAFDTDADHGVMPGRVMPYSYRVPHPLIAVGTNTESKIADAGRRGLYVHLGPTDFEQVKRLARVYRHALLEGGFDEAAIEQRMRWLIHTKWILVAETEEQAWQQAQMQFGMAVKFLPWLIQEPQYEDKSIRELHQMNPGRFAPSFGMPESPAAWVQRCQIIGTPETVAAELHRYEEIGVPHIHARWIFNDMGIDAGKASFRLFVDEVMPRLGIDRMPDLNDDEIRPEFRPVLSTHGKDAT
jgi:alkanesulfonate monooxygenase SsuD/methylene tetrahydromethanopterin reductase-like flavin-dependent oxidoreductase (luciferase family)